MLFEILILSKTEMRLYTKVVHHDGTNIFEIRELTPLGEELDNNWYSHEYIAQRHGATQNVKYLKNYGQK